MNRPAILPRKRRSGFSPDAYAALHYLVGGATLSETWIGAQDGRTAANNLRWSPRATMSGN